jgi:hypothetical protein
MFHPSAAYCPTNGSPFVPPPVALTVHVPARTKAVETIRTKNSVLKEYDMENKDLTHVDA